MQKDEEASDSDEEDSDDDDEEEVDEEEIDQIQNVNYASNRATTATATVTNNQHDDLDQEEISDEDDEESEIESEEDNGENNELPEEYLVAQRLNNESGSNFTSYENMQNSNAHNLNNNSSTANNLADQGPPYTKSNASSDLQSDLNDGIICNKGRGKYLLFKFKFNY